ncbi:MAG TPA: DUF1501 domain-containing protein [Pirellulales bacterium]|nr:DUF1501 domain-containing protein [Pirellulales bacterium]
MNSFSSEPCLHVNFAADGRMSRRRLLQLSGSALAASSLLGRISAQAAELKRQQRSCILVWLGGGPSQMETWDPKPGTPNGGETKGISTAVSGVQIAEYWPKIAQGLKNWAVIRSMTNKEGSHERATYQLHTGRRPTGALKFPNIGSVVAEQLGDREAELPNFVSVGQTIGSGFLGVHSQPFIVNRPGSLPDNVASAVPPERLKRRLAELERQNASFAELGAAHVVGEQQGLYAQGARMMLSPKLKAFQLDDESEKTRDAYGRSSFGQGLLVARRLVETGVPFVEVHRGGWDNHRNIFKSVSNLAGEVDQGLDALVNDLSQRGLLERNLVVCMGEFGRTPKVNANTGRDHWPKTFSLLLAGAGIRGGRVIGKTTTDGTEVDQDPTSVEDLFQTVCHAIGLNPSDELISPSGRPLKIVDGGQLITGLFS